MKNTVKLFSLIALTALIGFAACDDENDTGNTGPGNTEGDINWSADVNGAADTEDSTKITLTFTAAITGLTVGDITLTNGTGSAAKGSLSGSGAGYVLFITVTTPGTISVKVTKDGVSADAQDVTVHKKLSVIPWSAAADGTLSAVDSTKITFTFPVAIDGLTKDDITLDTITVSVTKGELTGSGTSWELGITVTKQGYITAAIAKTGVSAAPQQVQVFKAAVNPISAGRITYINDGEQVVFSGGGTYTLNSHGTEVENSKWIWEPKAEGSYTWDSSAQTLTLTLEKVADDDGVMTPKADAMPLFEGWIGEEIEDEITARIAWSHEEHDVAEAEVLKSRNSENGTAYATMAELINYLAEIRLNETFITRTYTYTFSNDGVSLILLEDLPEPVGIDELAGKTFYGTIVNWLTGTSRPNLNHIYEFFADGRTYIETGHDGDETTTTTISTGYYSYNSSTKRVHLQPAAKNGQTPEQYYDEAEYYDTFDRYPSEADSRTSQTHQHFRLLHYEYRPTTNIIDSRDSDEIEGL
jgi:hypothetical protein